MFFSQEAMWEDIPRQALSGSLLVNCLHSPSHPADAREKTRTNQPNRERLFCQQPATPAPQGNRVSGPTLPMTAFWYFQWEWLMLNYCYHCVLFEVAITKLSGCYLSKKKKVGCSLFNSDPTLLHLSQHQDTFPSTWALCTLELLTALCTLHSCIIRGWLSFKCNSKPRLTNLHALHLREMPFHFFSSFKT